MKTKSLVASIALALCLFASCAQADVTNLTINSGTYFDGRFFVGAYNSTISAHDAQDPDLSFPAITFCIDYTAHVGFGETFGVQIVNLANYHGALQQNYWEAGYIYLQMASITDVAILSIMQKAAWLITTPGSADPYLLNPAEPVFAWVLQAQQNYQTVAASTFTLYLATGDRGQSQISINSVPEPTTMAMAGVGLLALIGFNRLRHRA